MRWPPLYPNMLVTEFHGTRPEVMDDLSRRTQDLLAQCMEHLPGAGQPETAFAAVICDRCGAIVHFDPLTEEPPSETWALGPEGDLCPKCVADDER